LLESFAFQITKLALDFLQRSNERAHFIWKGAARYVWGAHACGVLVATSCCDELS
jgi:hypothetical protein